MLLIEVPKDVSSWGHLVSTILELVSDSQGILILRTAGRSEVAGSDVAGQCSGLGIYYFADGSQYQGAWNHGKYAARALNGKWARLNDRRTRRAAWSGLFRSRGRFARPSRGFHAVN